jgi:hypothetical protein
MTFAHSTTMWLVTFVHPAASGWRKRAAYRRPFPQPLMSRAAARASLFSASPRSFAPHLTTAPLTRRSASASLSTGRPGTPTLATDITTSANVAALSHGAPFTNHATALPDAPTLANCSAALAHHSTTADNSTAITPALAHNAAGAGSAAPHTCTTPHSTAWGDRHVSDQLGVAYDR